MIGYEDDKMNNATLLILLICKWILLIMTIIFLFNPPKWVKQLDLKLIGLILMAVSTIAIITGYAYFYVTVALGIIFIIIDLVTNQNEMY